MLKKNKLYLDSEYKYECEHKIDYLNIETDSNLQSDEANENGLHIKTKLIKKNTNISGESNAISRRVSTNLADNTITEEVENEEN